MTSLASERRWLLDPSLLKLFHQCRRLIHSEFGVKLHLTEEHLEQQLAEYASKSRSSHLARAWQALQEKVPQLNPPLENQAPEPPSRRMYRGQPIAHESDGKNEVSGSVSGQATETPNAKKSRVVYRGQVVG
ncbi:hypothetical protein LPB19_05825 [Marinobacter salinisoli]|uniref:Uncharacterized protein n=1 Tax=Marinobacter salinisoli TaxID=2769486 RepID=A0ABX7MU56_9GAMM|nr:hypothetical protein [Marinobacter salinisoli]QSP95922.1 hypothetical protein LPB19_05825 [Marinobacter salinisoli]